MRCDEMRRKRSKTTTRTVVISPSSSAMYIPVMSPCAPSNTSGFSNVKKAVPDVPSRLFVSFTSGTHVSTESRTKEICAALETTKARREVPPPEEKRETPLCREEEWKDVVVDEMVDAREEREEDISNVIVLTINVTRVLWIKKKKKKKKKRAEGTLSI
jgi:hypothetical protein